MVAGKSNGSTSTLLAVDGEQTGEQLLLSLSQVEWRLPLGRGMLVVSLFDPSSSFPLFSDTSELIESAALWGEPILLEDVPNAAFVYDQRHHPIAVGVLQLREQSEYVLEVSWEGEGPTPALRCFPQLYQGHAVMTELPVRQRLRNKRHRARLNYRDFVGATALQVWVGRELAFDVALEVRSKKLGYLDDYVSLLDAIAARSVALLLRLGSPVAAEFFPGAAMPISTGLVQMLVLRHVIAGGWLEEAIQQIAYAPKMSLMRAQRRGELGRHPMSTSLEATSGFRRGGAMVALAGYDSRLQVNTKGVLPRIFERKGQLLAFDTPENRFVGMLFSRLEVLLCQLQALFSSRPRHGFFLELQRLHELLAQLRRGCHFLRDLPDVIAGELPRQQLQLHRGYRELLEIWDIIDFDLQLTESQDGYSRDEALLGPLRDLAGLYEIWCFFALWEALSTFADGPDARGWMRQTGWRTTAALPRHAVPFTFAGMRLWLSYQRRFRTGEGADHSYSVALTPDFTIEVERGDGECVMLCFDAKYRPDGALEKMHAYRDALRGALGCYLFYPGAQEQPTLFHRHPRFPLPGVGAFPLRPSSDLDEWLAPFLRLCLEQLAGIPIS